MRKLLTTSRLDGRMRSFLKHHPELTIEVRRAMNGLVGDRHPSNLKMHKLGGMLKGCLAASISYEYRIVFILRPGMICFIDIGAHDEVYR